jgi:D-alanine-D-alanine ligase
MDNTFADECKSVALGAWKALGGLDGGRVDVKADRNGKICFIEVNPLAGLHPVDSDLPILSRFSGIEYQELIERIVNSAIKRYNLKI